MQSLRRISEYIISCLLIVWVAYLAVKKGQDLATQHALSKQREASWTALVNDRLPIMGQAGAPFKIVEFSDYQCPYCALADKDLLSFVKLHPSSVAVYRYDMPLLKIHRYAYRAAIAANCAEEQGLREGFQAELFKHQREFGSLDWVKLAQNTGIEDAGSFSGCVQNNKTHGAVIKDLQRGESLGVTGTPYFMVNGEPLEGGFSPQKLEVLFKRSGNRVSRVWHRVLGRE